MESMAILSNDAMFERILTMDNIPLLYNYYCND